MICVREAEQLIARNISLAPIERIAIADAAGRVLRQDIVAERDQPPFDRAMMDGIAVNSATGQRAFDVAGEAAAGAPAQTLSSADQCLHVMTGAPMPIGADCVVPVEQTTSVENRITIADDAVLEAGRFVHPRGSDHRAGSQLLGSGTVLGGNEIAVVAAAGCAHIDVSRVPRIAVCATGDELVEVDAPVLDHQIRRTNDYAIAAALDDWGFAHNCRVHASDDVAAVTRVVSDALATNDVLILSGGVSKGRYDYVAQVLGELGVKQVFHRVAQKPGKPLWFGVSPSGQPVFGLPGNPVSALVCLRRHVLPALSLMVGARREARCGRAVVADAFSFSPALTCFVPAVSEFLPDARMQVSVRQTNTSGDFTALAGTDGFFELAADQQHIKAGHAVRWFAW